MCGLTAVVWLTGAPTECLTPLTALEAIVRRGPDQLGKCSLRDGRVWLAAAVLHMRGETLTAQPLADGHGNILLWNGEVFGGDPLPVPHKSDTEAVLAALAGAGAVQHVLAHIEGPYAFVFWHEASSTLWYGRDPLGRRSLLRRLDEYDRSPSGVSALGRVPRWRSMRLSSVAANFEDDAGQSFAGSECAWLELPTDGIGSVHLLPCGGTEMRWHTWSSIGRSAPQRLPTCDAWRIPAWLQRERAAAASELVRRLSDAVRRRVSSEFGARTPPASCRGEGGSRSHKARAAVMFSGGIDSMVLARLADIHLPAGEPIDLLNVAFGVEAAVAPDRLTGLAGVEELRRLSPRRDFRLIEIDITLAELLDARSRLIELLLPASTVMDVNIGAALWFGARGVGVLRPQAQSLSSTIGSAAAAVCRYYGEEGAPTESALAEALPPRAVLEVTIGLGKETGGKPLELSIDWLGRGGSDLASPTGLHIAAGRRPAAHGQWMGQRALPDSMACHGPVMAGHGQALDGCASVTRDGSADLFRSEARVLLLGMGADEQMAGYGRHRTTYSRQGWDGLSATLDEERERIWLRNLGRDDRIISDWGREARHPYLDEAVMRLLAELPLPLICDLSQGFGCGDKLILRNAARLLGLTRSSRLQKRAIQFGTRIANRGVYGGASVRGDVDLSEIVHPRAQDSGRAVGAPLRAELNKKRRGPPQTK